MYDTQGRSILNYLNYTSEIMVNTTKSLFLNVRRVSI